MARFILLLMILLPAVAHAQPKAMPVTCDGEKVLVHDLASGQSHALHSKGASECVVDNRRRLVWFVDEGDLHILELSNGRVRRVVKNVERYMIEGNDNRLLSPGVLARPTVGGTTRLRLDSGKVVLEYDPRPELGSEAEKMERSHEPKIASKEVLGDLAERLPSRQRTCKECFEEAEFEAEVHNFSDAYREENCQQACGSGWAIPNSRLYMLSITDGCGDDCYQNLALYDPKRRLFIDPLTGESDAHAGSDAVFGERPTYSVYFERSGERMLVSAGDRTILMTSTFQSVAELDGKAAGWLYANFSVKVDEAKPNDFSYVSIGRDCLRTTEISKVRASFEVDDIGRASRVKIQGADGHAAACVAARLVIQKWHREGPHRVVWNVKPPRYLR